MKNTGRNDPCPCGSGKKYKQCCISREAPQAARMQPVNAQIPLALRTAIAHHDAGQLHQAEIIYRQILQVAPDHPDALHLLGLIAHQAGKHEIAVELISKAIGINPVIPLYYSNLGSAFMALGKLDEAVESYRKAVSCKPDFAEMHFNLGNALQGQGKLDEAAESLRRALSHKPGYTEAHNNLGNVLLAQNKMDEAAESFRKALLYKPDYAEPHNNLGIILLAQGKLDEAAESFCKALSCNPGYAEAHNNLGNVFLEQGKLDEAAESFRKALSYKPDYAEAHNNLGRALNKQGYPDAAIESFQEAIAVNPDFEMAYLYLIDALRELGRFEESAVYCRKYLELKPDAANVYCNLGHALKYMGQHEAAIESVNKALSLKHNSPDALSTLALIYADLGKFDLAREALFKALECEPEHVGALAMLPQLRKMTTADSAWLEAVLKVASKPDLAGDYPISLGFAIGKYYDDTAQYDLAFSAYQQANALRRKKTGKVLDRTGFSQYVDTVVASYTKDFFCQQREEASQSSLPIFIVGMPRSGTSLAEQIIASHPDAFGAGELTFWGSRIRIHPAALSSGSIEAEPIGQMAGEYEQLLRQYSGEAIRIVDKAPGNFLCLGMIHTLFPQARIIHTRRNPVDTCLSIYFQNFLSQHLYATDLEDLAFYFREYERLMQHWRSVLPADRFLEVSYESLTEDAPFWSRKIIEFTGLDWNECCLDFHKTERKVGTASNWQVRQNIYHTSKERWRNYEKHLGPLLGLLGNSPDGA